MFMCDICRPLFRLVQHKNLSYMLMFQESLRQHENIKKNFLEGASIVVSVTLYRHYHRHREVGNCMLRTAHNKRMPAGDHSDRRLALMTSYDCEYVQSLIASALSGHDERSSDGPPTFRIFFINIHLISHISSPCKCREMGFSWHFL